MEQTNSETSFKAKEAIIKKTLESIFQEYDDRAGNRSGYLDDIETCWTDKAIKDAMYDTYLKARLASLDDCKTLIKELREKYIGRRDFVEALLAELERRTKT